MAEEKEQKTDDRKLSFKNSEELVTFLTELQGQMTTMQETVENLTPGKEEGKEEKEEGKEGKEGKEELTDEEISEIDKLLQT